MPISSPGAQTLRAQISKRFPLLLVTSLIAAVATFAGTGKAAGKVPAVPASGSISALTWSFTAVEGQSFSGNVAAFTDSNAVTASNFTSIVINWGDGASTPGAALESGTNLFYISGTHTYVEEGSFTPAVSFHDVLNNTNLNLSSSTATVDDAPLCVCLAVIPGTPQTFSGTGGNNSGGGAHNSQQAFQAAIGGINNGSNPAPQSGGFRTINWDGVLLNGTDFGGDTFVIDPNKTVGIPVNRFHERGLLFSRVNAVSNDGFADVNPGVIGVLTAFSPSNDFVPFNTHEVDLNFVPASPHTTTAVTAGTRGFGGIFINVRIPNQTSIEYFAGSISLGKFFVPVGPTYSFLGELFNQPIVTRVHLTLGSGTVFTFDGTTFTAGASDNLLAGTNVVALDDLAYSEPQPAQTVIITPTVGTPFTGTVGTVTDTDPNGNATDFAATIDWGDGHASPGQISASGGGGFNIRGSNTYATGGNFKITYSV